MSAWLEPRDLLLILGQDVGEKLQSHVPAELGIASAIHLAHAARADERVDLEGSQPGPTGKGHARYATTAAGIETGTPAVIVDRRPWSNAEKGPCGAANVEWDQVRSSLWKVTAGKFTIDTATRFT